MSSGEGPNARSPFTVIRMTAAVFDRPVANQTAHHLPKRLGANTWARQGAQPSTDPARTRKCGSTCPLAYYQGAAFRLPSDDRGKPIVAPTSCEVSAPI